MPLSILLPMVVLGILGVALILHLKGFTESLQFADETEVRQHFHRLLPFTEVGAVLLSQDGHAAIVETPDMRYLIWSFGSDCTVHWLAGADIEDIPAGVHIHLHDFAAPGPKIALSRTEKPLWLTQLRGNAQ